MILNIVVIVVALTVAGALAFSRRLSGSSSWRATVTPLASIMGSGFLISAPLLAGFVGDRALFFMAALLALAYAVGAVIRFNIEHFEPIEDEPVGPAQSIAALSRVVLAAAYCISVCYYLQLLATFALHALGLQSPALANWITSGLLAVIGLVGVWRGLGLLERVESYAVSINLGMIAALVLALAVFNARLLLQGNWQLPETASDLDARDIRYLLGLLIVVQGFETSRYLGHRHPAPQRIATMRWAQLISSAIYLVFIALATILFHPGLGGDVAAIIDMMRPVAAVLPALLAIAAIGSQFSAGVADTAGAGGLIEEISHDRIPARYTYLLVLFVTLGLSWETNVNQIIAYASRAFALYYTLQCAVGLAVLLGDPSLPRRRLRMIGFSTVLLLCLLVFALGLPSE